MCSVGLMTSFCPSCVLVGLIVLPFELLFRLIKRAISSGARDAGSPRA
jgi:hypothetical protein